MPLSRLELETSGFHTMLGFMHQPDEPKSLSSWEEVGNPQLGRGGQSTNTSQHSHSHAAGIRRKYGNQKGSEGLKRCLYQDSNSRPLALIPC